MGWEWRYDIDEHGICRVTLIQRYRTGVYEIHRHFTMEEFSDNDFFSIWFEVEIIRMWKHMFCNQVLVKEN